MAESIYTQLKNQTAITPVDGTDYTVSLPTDLFPTDTQFESNDELIKWAADMGYTAKLIQKGLQKAIIEVRACFKSCPKDKTWTESMGIENLNKLEWKTVDRPNQGGTKKVTDARFVDCMNMVLKLTSKGLDMEMIKDSVSAVYDAEIVTGTFDAIEKMKTDTE